MTPLASRRQQRETLMRQAVYEGPRTIAVGERPRPVVGPRDALVAVDACGVCGSDVASYLHGRHVAPGQVMGHEATGVVAAVGGEVAHVRPGDRVAVRPLRACGRCAYCRAGEEHICGRTAAGSLGYGADGAFADLLLLRDEVAGRQLVALDPSTPVLDAVWAEPVAVALHALDRAPVRPGDRVLVLGAGPIGLALIAAARVAGAVPAAVEPRAARRAAALAAGAARAVAPGAALDAADVVLDSSGAASAIAAGAACLQPGGALVLVGLGERALPPPPAGVRVRGAFAFTPRDFLRAARLIERGAVRLGAAVSHTYPLEETGRAIAAAAHDAVAVKVVVRPVPVHETEVPRDEQPNLAR